MKIIMKMRKVNQKMDLLKSNNILNKHSKYKYLTPERESKTY